VTNTPQGGGQSALGPAGGRIGGDPGATRRLLEAAAIGVPHELKGEANRGGSPVLRAQVMMRPTH